MRTEDNCITRLVAAEHAVGLNCIVSSYVNWSQLYYTSCRHGVRTGTKLYCFALCELKSTVLNVLSTRSTHWNGTVLFPLCELKSTVFSPYANWRQLYYTSCWRGVCSGTELYCFALCELKSTVLHVLMTRSTQWNWTALFSLCGLYSTVFSPYANWRQLYYTSFWRGVRSGTELYCFGLCGLKSTVLHVLSTRSTQWNWTVLFRPTRTEVNCITRLVDEEYALELNCIVSPCANWSQLYYTSCRRGVRSGTELYCFALCELKSTVLHVLSTRSMHWNWTVLFRLVLTEVTLLASVPT